jgi:hypothetical protein
MRRIGLQNSITYIVVITIKQKLKFELKGM